MPPLHKNKELNHIEVKRLTALLELSRKMTSVNNLEEVLKSVVMVAKQQTQAGSTSLMLLEDTHHLVYKVGENVDSEHLVNLRIKVGDGIAGSVAQTGKPIWVRDIETDKRYHRKNLPKYKTPSFICVPLISNEKVIGVLNVTDKEDSQTFEQDDFNLITILASQAAMTIENARLYLSTQEIKIYLQNVLDNLTEAIIVIDTDNKCTFINSLAYRILDTRVDDPIGKEYPQVFPDKIIQILNRVIRNIYIYGSIIEEEVEFPDQVGGINTLGFSGSLMKIKDKITGVIVVIRDMTVTHELAKLRVMNQMKSEFISMVSHDLRTPLTAIKGSVTLMADEKIGKVNSLQSEMLNLVQRNTERLTRIIDDLLEISYAESGQPLRLNITKFSLPELLNDIVKLFEQQATEHELSLKLIKPETMEDVAGDASRIQQVLVNLIGNALKYTPAGGTVRVRARDEDDFWEVSVEDSGIGIPEDEIDKIFHIYYQVHQKNTETHWKGFGLGLAICKRIVDGHKGTIRVTSQEGKGSTFSFQIPHDLLED